MICLVRHGEAAASWGDHPDPGLSDLGLKQAEAAAVLIRDLGMTNAICSPMQRCRETARAFEHLTGISPVVEPAVSEISTPSDVEDRIAWLRTLMAGSWPSADADLAAWRTGILDCVNSLPDGTVVFSHFVAINALAGMLSGSDDVVVFRPGHCSITQLHRPAGKLEILQYGSESATRVL